MRVTKIPNFIKFTWNLKKKLDRTDILCYNVNMIRYCLGFAFGEDLHDVVLIKKQRPEWQKGLLNGVGGKVETSESGLDAMVREFEEETGLYHPYWLHFGTLRGEDWTVYLYTTRIQWDAITLIDCNKTDEEIILADSDNLSGTIPNLMWLVPMAKYSLQKKEFFQINEINLQQ